MEWYGKIAGEGFSLVLACLLALVYGVLLVAVLPFFLLGFVKRGLVSAITGGDPLVP